MLSTLKRFCGPKSEHKNIRLILSLVSLGGSGSSLSSKSSCSPCSNKTDLLARRSITPDCTCMSNVLVVTSSVRMLNWVHSHTTNLRPAVPLHSEFVVCITSLEHWLFSPTTTGNLPNHCPAATWHNLLRTRRKLDPVKNM